MNKLINIIFWISTAILLVLMLSCFFVVQLKGLFGQSVFAGWCIALLVDALVFFFSFAYELTREPATNS